MSAEDEFEEVERVTTEFTKEEINRIQGASYLTGVRSGKTYALGQIEQTIATWFGQNILIDPDHKTVTVPDKAYKEVVFAVLRDIRDTRKEIEKEKKDAH